THARGRALPGPDTVPAATDLDALRARLAPVRERAGAYADYRAAGFGYGPSFQVIEEIRSGEGEALLRLVGPESPAGMVLAPALLDGALRACHWAGRSAAPRPGELAVPFSLGAVEVFAALPAVVYAHARLVSESAGVRRFDLTIHDEQGQTLAVLRDFAGRTPNAPAPAAGSPRAYQPYWRTAVEPDSGAAAGTLLLVGELPGLEPALAATGTWRRIVTVAEDPDRIAGLLTELGELPSLDLAFVSGFGSGPSLTPGTGDALVLDTELDRACFAVLEVLRAVESGVLQGRVRCVIAHPQDDGQDRAGRAALAGFARSTGPIAPRLELLTLGLPAGAAAAEVAAALVVELRAAPRAAGLEVRRTPAGDREVRVLRALPDGAAVGSPLRERGVYVITGGSGAIGRLLAEHLARSFRARLVLIGRSAPDAETARWQQSLAEHGAQVLALRADVARAGELAAALAVARERFGVLHGVFHLAGVADDGRATDGGRERFARVLAAKTRGLVHLDQLTREDALDLFTVFSSVSSLVGDFGAASYATANRFADLYIARREAWVGEGVRSGRSLALDWPLWSVGGVDALVRAEELTAYTRRSGMPALTAEQALGAFEYALTAGASWLLPAWGEAATMDAALLERAEPSRPAPAPEPALVNDGRRTRAAVVEYLRTVLSGVLKLPAGRLDSRVALDDYGLDSVLVMESNTLLGKDFPGLRGTVFFECRTVDELADHLLAEHPEAVARMFPETAAPTPAQVSPVAVTAAAPAVSASVRPEPAGDEPIAIIGISGRYPQARDLDEFWRNLAAGRDCVTEVPADRWDAEALFDADPAAPGRSYSRWGGFLSDVDSFDSLFFQISPAQARSMDPQERLFLETAWSALENAGYPPSRIPAPRFGGQGHDVGVFVGVMWDDYAILAAAESARGNHQVVLANRSAIANQVSYFGDFRGPSVVVDTACSASLVALHQACESLRRGECSYAIAGGVNVAVHPDKYVHLSRKTMLASDGRCRAFGAGGSGYVPGEGVGAVLLKPLSRAVADGDTIHAVIRSTAVNHGGRTSGFTVPNPHAQQALVEQALAAAGISARSIGCLEAHGTGTALGDPIEHTALAQAFAKHTADTGFCALGSVKSAIGHLEGAAGIAGVTKAVLQLRNGTLLPTLHAEESNPVIDFTRSPFTLQRESAPWPQPRDAEGRVLPRRAAVSSFGAGGTNAHVILEEYLAPEQSAAPAGPGSPELIVLSARDEGRLRAYAAELGRALTDPAHPAHPTHPTHSVQPVQPAHPVRLADLAYTLRVGREAMGERLAFVAADLAEAAERFAAVGRGEGGQWLHHGRVRQHPPLEGLFTEGSGGEEFLAAQVRADGDDLLARLWVCGIALDWDLVHRLRPAARRRVPLPTYPFERVRHWLDLGAAATPVPTKTVDPSPRVWRRILAASEPVLRDHVVAGRPILPGVGHLDLVAEARGGLIGQALADVRWLAPLAVEGTEEQVEVRFEDEQGGERYEVLGADGAVRSRGRLVAASPAPGAVDLAALRAGLSAGPDGEAFYRLLAGQGLPYGPFFRRVEQVWTGRDEVLGRIGAVAEEAAHLLHPGVLDAALHTVAALLVRRRGGQARPMLPFAVDRVEVFGPVPQAGWSHVRETGPDRCDVLVLDEAGAVRVRFTGLTYREAKPPLQVGYRPTWTPQPAEGTAPAVGRVLLVGARLDEAMATGIARAHQGAQVRRLAIGPGGLTDAELDRALSEVGGPELVYFLGAEPEREPVDRAGVRAALEESVVSLYRLVRALDRHRLLERELGLKVVTAGVHPLEAGDDSRPWAAGLAGLAMVVGKEFPNLKVALVDLRAAEAEAGAVVAEVVAEPFAARPVPVSLRAGVRRVRVLERVELPLETSRLRQGGVYLIIGGLGAVGRDTCRYLARAYGARLVVVGRSPLDGPRRERVAELEAAGAQVRHLALDATDPVALGEAIAFAKREFGALHGVVNAAMVLVNQVVRELPEEGLRAALESKTDATWSVLRATAGEHLDFVLFYSSGVAFEGNHGQAGYAAGCTFADAYALHAARALPFPVRVLNLGYWNAGGDEERERVLRRFAAAGIRPMTAEQGMAVVERVLGGELPQLLALDADQRILDNLGVAPERTLSVLPGTVPAVLPVVRSRQEGVSEGELVEHQLAVVELEELAHRLLAAALDRAGLFEAVGHGCSRAELADRISVVAGHAALFQVQLDMLAGAGYLRIDGDRVSAGGRAVEGEAGAVRELEELVDRRKSVAPVAELLRDCLAVLPEVLTGRIGAMEVLFPDGSPERVAAVYRGDPVTDRCNAEVARLIVEQVQARLAAAPGATVRVLEVGAGTGGTSTAVLAALAPYGDSVDYLFTDVSPAFVRKGRQRFGADYPFARFEVLDIEAELAGQPAAALGGHDVVFGTNVFHATGRLGHTLAQTKRLLVAGGVLLMVEGTRAQHQLALVFGLTTGWWLFADPEQRLPGSPLASERQWRDALGACGFGYLSAASPTTEAGPAFQSVIAAVSDGLVPAVRQAAPTEVAPTAQAQEQAQTQAEAETPAPSPVPARQDDALERVTAVFARVLEMAPEQLDPDLTFEN
ncbi:SDR family NAD(P)-dependent oxidoreductase, partial [Kitasatospora sp. NPDC008050]|uniref:SDR family NAD(P)-dependent oxidoreductase n=1 Tax=Kitasatospora sp. NPDC008050 TaxID=3364021 RepID=UPI0036EA3627